MLRRCVFLGWMLLGVSWLLFLPRASAVVDAGLESIDSALLGWGGQSRFQRVVRSLSDDSLERQAYLAIAALRALAEAFSAEAELARQELLEKGENAKLRGWSTAVDRYANQLVSIQEQVEAGTLIELFFNADNALTVSVGEHAVMLNHPRIAQQGAFEQLVLADFCNRYQCNERVSAESERTPIPVSSSRVRPAWTFASAATLCSYRGIQVSFGTAGSLVESRSLCEQFLQEVITLADEISWQRRHGVAIQWESLQVSPTTQRPEHMIQLNMLGDTVLATVPVISGSPGLLGDVMPWLKNRVEYGTDTELKLIAAHYGWGTPSR